ncbi:MAG: hypothetical protein ACYTDY_13295, partial [Planctomycetota bacterium]
SDASGTRHFPFVLFAEAPVKLLLPHGAFVPYALATLWDRLSLAFPPLKEAESVEAIGSHLASLKLPAVPGVSDCRERFRRDAGLPGADVRAARGGLLDLVHLAKALREGQKGEFAVHIPLKTGYAPEVEAVAWLRFLSAKLLDPEIWLTTHLFLRTNRKALTADLFMFHRELKDSDLLFVLSPTDDYPYANLLGGTSEDPVAEDFAEWFETAMGDGATLNDLVELDLVRWRGK